MESASHPTSHPESHPTLLIIFALNAFTSLFLVLLGCLSHKPVFQTITKSFISRPKLSFISSIISEFSIYILLSKMLIVYELASIPNFFKTGLVRSLYWMDLAVMLTLWGLFLQGVFSRHPIYEATKFMRNSTSTTPPSIFTWSFWFRFSNPFWMSRTLLVHEGGIPDLSDCMFVY